jgi:transcription initiation factor TFIIIB Brf1 subunit/transcription initiation factor TFIIB
MSTVLMSKLKNITNLSELSSADIDLILRDYFVHPENEQNQNSNSLSINNECDAPIDRQKNGKSHIMEKTVTLLKNRVSHISCSFCHRDDTIVVDQFGGMILCKSCGQVLEDSLYDRSPEWKNYDDDGSAGRCGMPTNMLLQQSSLGTNIAGNCNYRLRTLHNWTRIPYKERSLSTVLNIIKQKCDEAGFIGRIADDAKILYNNAHNSKNPLGRNIIIRGKNRLGLMAACVFYACKRCGNSISLKDIAKLFNINTSRVNKGCKSFETYTSYMNIDYSTNISHPSQYIHQFCSQVKFNKKVIDEITMITKYVENNYHISSHTPISIAAACILEYVIKKSIKNVTRETITTIFKISDATLIKAHDKISECCKNIFNIDYLKQKTSVTNSNVMVTPLFLKNRLDTIQKINVEQYKDTFAFNPINYLNCDVLKYNIETVKKCTYMLNACDIDLFRVLCSKNI